MYHKEEIDIENVDEREFCYLAGIVDGEGSFRINGWKKCGSPRLDITNTNMKLLESIRLIFCGNISTDDDGNPKHKIRGRIVWNGKNTIKIIRKIYPYLRCKQKQALLLTEWYLLQEPRPRGRRTKQWLPISEEQLKIRNIINSEVQFLNKKGKGVDV